MHLLAAKPGGFSDEEGIIDLEQTPADMVILCAQDALLGALAQQAEQHPGLPSLRLANLIHLNKPAAFDLYAHKVLEQSKLVVVSLLGGEAYWSYGLRRLQELSLSHGFQLVVVPGDDQPDESLFAASSCKREVSVKIWRYLREGGKANITNCFAYLRHQFFQQAADYQPPKPLPRALIYHPHIADVSLKEWQACWIPEQPVVALVFYRSHLQSGNTQAFDDFIELIAQAGLNPLPVAVTSLKEAENLTILNDLLEKSRARVLLNTTGFSLGSTGNAHLSSSPTQSQDWFRSNIAILQVIMAGNSIEDWLSHPQGLRASDIAMNIALPEMDGRIISRAISFKDLIRYSDCCQLDIVGYKLVPDRALFVAELAKAWACLGEKNNTDKRVVLILANYPTRDGRIGNGVGLDTPQSTINILTAMAQAGYPVDNIPTDGTTLVQELLSGVTNDLDWLHTRHCNQSISLEAYKEYFSSLPAQNQQAVLERWGEPEKDPKVRQERIMVAGLTLGNTFVGIQPARGYNLDVAANYHDPDLVPPHSYLAFYFWLKFEYKLDAIAHIGKHGNLEWLPGKGVALSQNCWPEITLGPVPHLYPFIVNDPGEGAQAKRRAQAVVLDHLMPPMARAESYGVLTELENLVDEYYQAMGLDTRRETFLRDKILKLVESSSLKQELKPCENEDAVLNELDAYLCELKEAQIRNGLHIFGQLDKDDKYYETLVALIRLPRGDRDEDAGILHALATDLGLDFDPLSFDAAAPCHEFKPRQLSNLSNASWRTLADTRERLELLALALVAQNTPANDLPNTQKLLAHLERSISPALEFSAQNELNQFLNALNAGFVPPGPSGAPTRGRLDVLPTGRNFYSVDSRSIPTPAAWELGQASAEQLLLTHMQEHGDYPKSLGLSVWGTATMRTGGDDIAQAFALMGVKPIWAAGSNRVTNIEVVSGFLLGRPRVDVTLRISGFFRDAFPNVVHLYDLAIQALADYDDPGQLNTIKSNIDKQIDKLLAQGVDEKQARQQARWRVFGSKPGAYGAGLQGLIDERCWDTKDDLAVAYINWGGYAYGKQDDGTEAFDSFQDRLGELEAVVQNQDNREHDILDSDDYYQFQGGMANAVRVISGQQPEIYLNDHSNPSAPKTRTLNQELSRVIRSRVVNPKWIQAMQAHGYKGAFEMAASVDYLFAYDATTDQVSDYQYEMVTDALLLDPQNQEFLQQNNPDALREMSERLLEAMQRELWQEPGDYRSKVESLILQLDEGLEQTDQQ